MYPIGDQYGNSARDKSPNDRTVKRLKEEEKNY
jgi:hypothetical protein